MLPGQFYSFGSRGNAWIGRLVRVASWSCEIFNGRRGVAIWRSKPRHSRHTAKRCTIGIHSQVPQYLDATLQASSSQYQHHYCNYCRSRPTVLPASAVVEYPATFPQFGPSSALQYTVFMGPRRRHVYCIIHTTYRYRYMHRLQSVPPPR
jgi:hypothetical protein